MILISALQTSGSVIFGYEPDALDVLAVCVAVLWLLVVGGVRWARRPAEARMGLRTLDLGTEPPAVANLLVNDFALTHEAVPGTLLDLAARNVVDLQHMGPGQFVCRLDPRANPPSNEYEARILDLLRRRASGGVVPPEALTTGPAKESAKWWRGFRKEVVDDCQRQDLSRDLWDRRTLSTLTVIGLIPTPLFAAAFQWRVGFGYAVAVFALVGLLRSGRRQRETPAGLAAASRWLGVRSELREDQVLRSTPAITVETWERHLAYAAAFGLAGEASRLLGLEAESDTQAWSAYGGVWRRVRIRYPGGLLPLGWGLSPAGAIVRGLAFVLGGAVATVLLAGPLEGTQKVLVVPLVLLMAGGLLLAGRGIVDVGSAEEVTGPIMRLRNRGTDKSPRYYMAVDDGSSTVRAWIVSHELYALFHQDDVVTASVTPHLRHVRSVRPAAPRTET
jgi:hypothetical protein